MQKDQEADGWENGGREQEGKNLIWIGWTVSPNGANVTSGVEPGSNGQIELDEFGENGVRHLQALSPGCLMMMMIMMMRFIDVKKSVTYQRRLEMHCIVFQLQVRHHIRSIHYEIEERRIRLNCRRIHRVSLFCNEMCGYW